MENPGKCLYCDQDSELVPLINLQFQGQHYWICPQHLPILIHKPAQLAHKLPGSENLPASPGHEH